MSVAHRPCDGGLRSQTPDWTDRVRADTVKSAWGPKAVHIKNILSCVETHPHPHPSTHCLYLSSLGKRMPPILTCSLVKLKGGGGLPSPWQRSSTLSPSLTRPWGDSFHSSTMVEGSERTHTQNHIKQAYSAKVTSQSLFLDTDSTDYALTATVSLPPLHCLKQWTDRLRWRIIDNKKV